MASARDVPGLIEELAATHESSLHAGAAAKALDALERRLGLALPPSHRAFLGRTNGGLLGMWRFFSAGKVEKVPFDIEGHGRGFMGTVVPEIARGEVLAFATDWGGDLVCFDLRRRRADGECPVLLWQHDYAEEPETADEVWVESVEDLPAFLADLLVRCRRYAAEEAARKAARDAKAERALRRARSSRRKLVESLDLSHETTDALLAALVDGQTRLRTLRISDGMHVTDAGLRPLAALPALEQVRLHGLRFTGAGLVHLSALPLRSLEVDSNFVRSASLRHLAGSTTLEELRLDCERVTGAGVRHLRELTGLRRLDLGGCKVTDRDLAHLSALTRLEHLRLFLTGVRGPGLRRLGGLRRLRELDLSSTPLRTLEPLAGFASLTRLDLGCCRDLEGSELRWLSGLSRLRHLTLRAVRAADPDLAHLAALRRLEALDLSECANVTDEGLAALAGLRRLESLRLPHRITDAGVQRLAGLSRLRALDVSCSREVTVEGLTALRGLPLEELRLNHVVLSSRAARDLARLFPRSRVS